MGLRDITIRKFRTEDAKAVAKIIGDKLLAVNDDNSIEVNPKLVLTLSNKRKMYVAIDDNTIAGTASIDHEMISHVFVDTEYRNQGIEGALVSLLEEIAANNGFKQVKLEASMDAANLYENLGYSATDEMSANQLGKVIVMEKYLL